MYYRTFSYRLGSFSQFLGLSFLACNLNKIYKAITAAAAARAVKLLYDSQHIPLQELSAHP